MKKTVTHHGRKKTHIWLWYVLGAILAVSLFIVFVPNPHYTHGFETIDEVSADASTKEELADPEDYKDHRRPSWKTYHSKTQPGFIARKINNILALFGLKKRPYWSPSYFKYLLEKRFKEREAKGKSAQYEYVYRIVPSPKSRFIVFGDMSGAYHSMLRALKKFIELDMMDKDLKLKSKDDYIIFMGDVASRSPFIMELLTLIMKLEERNPDHIIYMTGNNERKGAWYPYGLREELQYKAHAYDSKNNPLYKVVEHYFETLPLGVYASVPPHENNDFVRFSHFAMETPSKEEYRDFLVELNDSYYSKDLLADREKGDKVIKLPKKQDVPDSELVNVRVVMKSYRKMKEFQKNAGLRLLEPDKNATAWTVLSSPTVIAIKSFDFWDDAFVIIQCAEQLKDWTITLYTRDIRQKEDFKTVQYKFLSGEKISDETEENIADDTAVSNEDTEIINNENAEELKEKKE